MEITTEALAAILEEAPGADPDVRADLDASAFSDAQGRHAWYTLLLHQTLQYAEAAVPFYRARLGRQCPPSTAFERLRDLARYPVLHKADVAADPRSFLSERATAETVHCTSGTTARRLHIYGNYEEERASELLRRLRGVSGESDALSLRIVPGPRRLYSPTHPGLGSRTLVVGYSSNQDNHQWFDYTDHLAEVLNNVYWFGGQAGRVRLIHLTPPWMFEFITRKFLDRGIDPSAFGVEVIGISGGFATSRTRRIVRDVWKAEATSSYSCSESTGEAREYRHNPAVYRPGPSFFCEIVDADTFEPVAPGEHGLVLVTSLYPFQQVMPFIRYNTGDIAEWVPVDGLEGADGEGDETRVSAFRPIGRIDDCVPIDRRRYFGTHKVLEALGPFDEIPHLPYPRYELERTGPEGDRTVCLRVETVAMSEGKRDRMRSQVLKNLEREHEVTSRGRAAGVTFRCEIVGKGDLRDYRRLVPSR